MFKKYHIFVISYNYYKMDVLSDILNSTRLSSAIYFKTDFSSPWGMNVPKGRYAQFHLVVRGQCILQTKSEKKSLFAGDMVVFPHGTSHWLADNEKSKRISGIEIVEAIANGKSYVRDNSISTTLLCGHFEFDKDLSHPFFKELPTLIHISDTETKELSWLNGITSLIIGETNYDQVGHSAVINRLGEVLFIHVIRAFIQQSSLRQGFIAALKDKRINKALNKIHSRLDENVSLDELAMVAGMSRTSFFNAFKELIGITPKKYILNWKMIKSKELIQNTENSISEICKMVGYSSESSFNKTFKKYTLMTPLEYRRKN